MELSMPSLSQRQWLGILSLLVLFVAYRTYIGSLRLHELGSDQVNLGVMILKDVNPELYSRDSLFKDSSIYQYYTPLYRQFIEFFVVLIGSSYSGILLGLMPVVMLFYLFGMFILLFSVTRHVWISLFVAILLAVF